MKPGTLVFALLVAASPATALAQEPAARGAAPSSSIEATQIEVGPSGEHLTGEQAEPVDIITPHIVDSRHLELPFAGEVELPRWEPVRIGGLTVDLSPTKHVVMLCIAALLCMLVLIPTAVVHERHTEESGAPRGFAAGMEAVVLYLRNEVVLRNVGAARQHVRAPSASRCSSSSSLRICSGSSPTAPPPRATSRSPRCSRS